MIYVAILGDNDGLVDGWVAHNPTALPQWVQERMAVIRLLEPLERSPLGWWVEKVAQYAPLYRLILTKEEQKEWFRWKGEALT